VGNVDLRGTAFAVAAGEFVIGGSAASGNAAYSSDNQVVELSALGGCGYLQPSPGVFNPFNQAGGAFLSLNYLHPAR
jgi:hypothetical protein